MPLNEVLVRCDNGMIASFSDVVVDLMHFPEEMPVQLKSYRLLVSGIGGQFFGFELEDWDSWRHIDSHQESDRIGSWTLILRRIF